MSTPTPEWHAEARRLYAEGVRIGEISRRLRKARSTVSWAVDSANTREAHKVRIRAQRKARATEATYHRVERKPAPAVEPAAPVEIDRKPTLPKISLPPIDEPMTVRRFAPRTRWSSKPGVERIRAIHLKMIREGRVVAPDLVSEWAH